MSPRVSEVSGGEKATSSFANSLVDDYARRVQANATYVIYKEDGTYYADHCLTSGHDYNDSNPDVVIESAIEGLTSGSVAALHFKPATYTFNDTVTVNRLRGLIITGEGAGIAGNSCLFVAPSGKPVFYLDGSGFGQALHCHLRNFEIKGATASGEIGLKLKQVQMSTFRELEFWNLDEGIRLEDGDHYNLFESIKMYNVNTGIYDEANSQRNTYHHIGMGTIADYGYNQPSTGTTNHIMFDSFGVESAENAHGIYIASGVINVHINGGYFVDVGKSASKSAIYFKGYSPTYPMKQCSITNSYFNRSGYGIQTDYMEGLLVENNQTLSSVDSGATFSANTKGLKKIRNDFDSESDSSIDKIDNGGTATVSNGTTETTVTHVCGYTPTAQEIDVHAIETLNNASFWYVDTITSTTFKIKVNADPGQDVDFKWSVRQIP